MFKGQHCILCYDSTGSMKVLLSQPKQRKHQNVSNLYHYPPEEMNWPDISYLGLQRVLLRQICRGIRSIHLGLISVFFIQLTIHKHALKTPCIHSLTSLNVKCSIPSMKILYYRPYVVCIYI